MKNCWVILDTKLAILLFATKIRKHKIYTKQQWDLVLIDPPRSGAKEVIDQLHLIAPKKVLYVSCHPASLARDANVLVNTLGYRMTRVCVINMFPHTGHVETMALFEKLD